MTNKNKNFDYLEEKYHLKSLCCGLHSAFTILNYQTRQRSAVVTFRSDRGIFTVCCRSSFTSSSVLLSPTSPLSSAPPTSSSFDVRGGKKGGVMAESKGEEQKMAETTVEVSSAW